MAFATPDEEKLTSCKTPLRSPSTQVQLQKIKEARSGPRDEKPDRASPHSDPL